MEKQRGGRILFVFLFSKRTDGTPIGNTWENYKMNDPIHVSKHPLVLHKLSLLRDAGTGPPAFRQLVRELSQMLFLEATCDLPVQEMVVQTPLAKCTGHRLAIDIGLIPILRAALGMAEAIQDLVPDAKVWHLGLYRDEVTKKPVTYYNKLPARPDVGICFVIDPMLATGGSAALAVEILKSQNIQHIRMLALVAAPEGVEKMRDEHPDVPIFATALDSHLNENKFIVPGLGDAGDRQFGTML